MQDLRDRFPLRTARRMGAVPTLPEDAVLDVDVSND